MALPTEARGAICRSQNNGDWTDASTWSCGREPNDGDSVIIETDVNLDRNITFGGGINIISGASLSSNNRSLDLTAGAFMRVAGVLDIKDLDNAGGINIEGSGSVTTSGSVNNNGGTIFNAGLVTVGGNLRNNPGGILTGGCGTWVVDVNAINAAGGFIDGCLDFRSDMDPGSCTDPFNNANSGTMDSTGITICGGALVLPVELVAFAGERRPEAVALQWSTASESNSSHFEVQRSTDGEQFTRVGTRQAAGRSTTPRAYAFEDRQAPPKRLFYRLRQVDFDGSEAFSQVIEIKATAAVAPPVRGYNPATQRLVLRPASTTSRFRMRLMDAQGRLHVQLANGKQSRQHLQLPAGLADGLYVVQWQQGAEAGHLRVLVQR